MSHDFFSLLNSLEKKLYQLIISRLDGLRIDSPEYRRNIIRLAENGIGGFIIFGGIRDEIRPFINEIQSVSEIPLFIASDIERGVGQQIHNTTLFPSQMAIAAAIDNKNPEHVAIFNEAIKAIAAEAIDAGINMPLMPVMDVNQNPDNPIICTRAFSDRPEVAAWFGSVYIENLQNAGLISCAKHFPGHGDTATDSHISLPVIEKSRENIFSIDLVPFVSAIKSEVGSIMVGHLSVPAIDSRPATLSNKIVSDLLRKELGFNGLILTDALNMDALSGSGNIPAECINAGVDILLHPADADDAVRELMNAAASGTLGEDRLNNSLTRILDAKAKLKNIIKRKTDYNKHSDLSRQLFDMSVTLIKGSPELLSVHDINNASLIFAGDRSLFESSILKDHFKSFEVLGTPIENLKTVIVAIFTSVSAWKGSSGIDESEKASINELIKKAEQSIVISFGSPYVLRFYGESDIIIAAYDGTVQAQEAVIKGLRGKANFNGRLPVTLNMQVQK